MSNLHQSDVEVMDGLKDTIKNYLAKKGYSSPDFSFLNFNNVMICNLSVYKGNYKQIMSEAYCEWCANAGFKEEWLKIRFFYPDVHQEVKIIGLDLDGGEHCIRLITSDGREFNAHPTKVKEYILVSIGGGLDLNE
ncbi:hypothetical protein [Vibrio parahaemolyticus]|uniref:hypothetical protein n=1 Tax=Vibrio parahaemolyticus TaxID=670 RepID=UPI0031CCA6E8